MSFSDLGKLVGNIFYTEEKKRKEEEQKNSAFQEKARKALGLESNTPSSSSFNPFLNSKGELFNPNLNYQKLLDSPISQISKNYITDATGLTPTRVQTNTAENGSGTGNNSTKPFAGFNANADPGGLASLDVVTELPKLTTNQISAIISKHFSRSPVISPSDAAGIYNAQQETGMSALAILGIGALESGYGTSTIAKQKNNLWGWNATNVNPGGNATTFAPVSHGAMEFAERYLKTYYNNYGAKSIYAAGTGNNPAGKGYAYHDSGAINPQWATSVGSIMGNFYNTAKNA